MTIIDHNHDVHSSSFAELEREVSRTPKQSLPSLLSLLCAVGPLPLCASLRLSHSTPAAQLLSMVKLQPSLACAYVVILTSSIVLTGGAAKTTLRGSGSRKNGNDGDDLLNSGVLEGEHSSDGIGNTRDSLSNHYDSAQPRQQHQYRRVIAEDGDASDSDGAASSLANIFASHTNTDNKDKSSSNSSSSSSNNDMSTRLHKESRIIGGSATGTTEFPFVVSIQDRYGHFCGGSLIAPNMVLTAA